MPLDKDKELIAVVDLIVDAIDDGIAVATGGVFSIVEVAKFSNLIPEIVPAFAGIGMVPAEVKALTFDDASAVVLHVVARLNITSTKAINIVTDSLKLAADAYALVVAIKS